MENAHAAGVVNMIVGYQDGIHVGHVPAMSSKPLPGSASADAGVEEQLLSTRFDVNTVTVAAGLERDDVHGRIVLCGRGA
jgi:hypothetical protein